MEDAHILEGAPFLEQPTLHTDFGYAQAVSCLQKQIRAKAFVLSKVQFNLTCVLCAEIDHGEAQRCTERLQAGCVPASRKVDAMGR